MPSGPPTSSIASTTPEPTPLRSGDSSTSAAEVEVASARPIPAPTTTIHIATNKPLESTLVVAPTDSPTTSRPNPPATASLAPTSLASRAAGTAPIRTPPISGKSLIPEPIAVVPRTPWKYCGIVNRTPINARNDIAAKIEPQVNDAELNSVMSSNG